ncbi:hypothetical protein Tco_0320374 [Tanacetum coccineum]
MKKAFQDMLHGLGEVNPVHAYYNGSCTSKDNKDPSWSTSFKTRRTQKTSSALEDFIYVVFVPDRNIILLKIGMLVWGEADSETSPKRSLRRKLFKTCCMDWGEVNQVHAYYNGSCTSKDNEDPSWSTSFKTRRTQKTSSALDVLWKTLFLLYLYLIGTL